MKQAIIRTVEIAIILAAIVTVVRPYYLSKISANTKCYAGAGEICPDAVFLDDYKEMTALNQQLEEGKRSSVVRRIVVVSDQLAGLTYRLQSQIPQGYVFKSEKGKFIAVSVAPTAPAPAAVDNAPKGAPVVAQPAPPSGKKATEIKK